MAGFLLGLGLSVTPATVLGQSLPPGTVNDAANARRAEAVQVTAGSVEIDGVLDDPAWGSAGGENVLAVKFTYWLPL